MMSYTVIKGGNERQKPGPKRKDPKKVKDTIIPTRYDPVLLNAIEQFAEDMQVSRSKAIRLLVGYGLNYYYFTDKD